MTTLPDCPADPDSAAPPPPAADPEKSTAASPPPPRDGAPDPIVLPPTEIGLVVGESPAAAAEGGPDDAVVSEQAAPGLLRLLRRQEIAFAAVGGGNTLLGMVLTVFWLKVLGPSWPPAAAVVLAYCLSILAAFVAHRTLVFRVRGHLWRDFARFIVVNSGGLLLNTVGVQLAVGSLHLPDTPATVVVMGVVAVASYFGHRYFSFRRAPEQPAGDDR
ncbi:GtrA family protein [Nocardia sp. alder85J]|uniref:GtrA family protein n=1 Tax=Nocardia sp. alder85J TaxID=2862949 RepID=UPI001CD5041D|nr:GtrA family protein [Nocardia sp. alder85J]MCX4094403.1 GtrA family protein [Nocardia sp. alder85J]